MPGVPDFQAHMRPLLEANADGRSRSTGEIRSALTQYFSLTDDDLAERIPSGRVTVFQNRVGWALTYLTRAGALERPRRATYHITERGLQLLAEHPDEIRVMHLKRFPEFAEFHTSTTSQAAAAPTPAPSVDDAGTPEELIEASHSQVESALVEELLDLVKAQTPEFFETLVLDVLIAMGYGGSRADAAQHLGRSGDEGVDGVIQEDRLGLDSIYVQAKKYADRTVGRPDVQAFVGALQGQQATKGVFITTTDFSPDARQYAQSVPVSVILISGQRLAGLMVDHGVGVTVRQTYELKAVDRDYFPDDVEA